VLPWGHWLPARAVDPLAEPLDPRARVRASSRLSVALAALAMLAWWPGVRAYAALHHRPRAFSGGEASVVARQTIEVFGPLVVGDDLADGWRIATMQREAERIVVVVARDGGGRAVLWVSSRDRARAPSPFDGEAVAVAYGDASVPIAELEAGVRELTRRLDEAAVRGELRWQLE